jgi:hypothetical protein
MIPSLVAHSFAQTDVNHSVTAPTNTTGADFIALVVTYYSGGGQVISDNKGNTWAALTAGSLVSFTQIFYCFNPIVGSGHTFQITQTGGAPGIAMLAFSGGATKTTIDQNTNNAGGAGTGTGTVTPIGNNGILVYGISGQWLSGPISVSVGTITDQGVDVPVASFALAAAYYVQTTAAPINPIFLVNGSAAIGSFSTVLHNGNGGRGIILGGNGSLPSITAVSAAMIASSGRAIMRNKIVQRRGVLRELIGI